MGTRADFYMGFGVYAEWLGSIAWDGYPEGIPSSIVQATTPEAFRQATQELATREDWTSPNQGWPWPWDNSLTTDYSYAFGDGRVWATHWGYDWYHADQPQPDAEPEYDKKCVFPDMTARRRVTFGKRSGVMVIGPHGVVNE